MDVVTEENNKYENIVVVLLTILSQTSWKFASIIISLSVVLMQGHNENEYILFLRILYKLKIYYICCGCRKIFVDAGHEGRNQVAGKTSFKSEAETNPVNSLHIDSRKHTIVTLESPRDHSVKVDHSQFSQHDEPSI